ncbi:calvin cycle protein CP12-3, chloroplastic [Ipomoea triloba]|uniref:calvin cycle protein CP12-3, chloroplastic n=1 Tax=Ipomoea triloba TaxID=35885 RepID=UPI00125D075B|nr:calvin cycle protein CP12-3, chloroplastic [Ipomoea triloba]
MGSLSLTGFSLNLKPSVPQGPGLFRSGLPPRKVMQQQVEIRRVKATSGGAKYKGTYMREKQLEEMIEKMVKEAKEVCGEDETSDECKVAWDEVEEVSQAKADLRLKLEKQQDPLESFCQDNPETDECRIYEH